MKRAWRNDHAYDDWYDDGGQQPVYPPFPPPFFQQPWHPQANGPFPWPGPMGGAVQFDCQGNPLGNAQMWNFAEPARTLFGLMASLSQPHFPMNPHVPFFNVPDPSWDGPGPSWNGPGPHFNGRGRRQWNRGYGGPPPAKKKNKSKNRRNGQQNATSQSMAQSVVSTPEAVAKSRFSPFKRYRAKNDAGERLEKLVEKKGSVQSSGRKSLDVISEAMKLEIERYGDADLVLADPWSTPKDRILSLESLHDSIIPQFPPSSLFSPSDKNSKISKEIWNFFAGRSQNQTLFKQKIRLWAELDNVIRSRWTSRTLAFGSTMSGFASDSSDMDLCVFVEDIQQKDVTYLAMIRNVIKRECKGFIHNNIELIPAKVPILKLFDYQGEIEVDLGCNSREGPLNTHMLFCYSQLDWRVRPLVLAIKSWAKAQNINDAKIGTFSSYTLTLMVINFLQCGVSPPVLPSLQLVFPRMFQKEADIFVLPYINRLPKYESLNEESLGDLFIGFFEHYRRIDFTQDVASVRTGRLLTNKECEDHARANKIRPGQWRAYVCVEEPMERTNAARAIVRRDQFDLMLGAFERAVTTLRGGEGATLEELLAAKFVFNLE